MDHDGGDDDADDDGISIVSPNNILIVLNFGVRLMNSIKTSTLKQQSTNKFILESSLENALI